MQNLTNLEETYGHKYRIDYERYINGKIVGRSPEYQQLMSKRGCVYVHSPTHLGFATDVRRNVFDKPPEMQLVQDGDDGQNYIFKIEDFDKLATIMELRRRRNLSESEKNRLRNIGEDSQFGKDAA